MFWLFRKILIPVVAFGCGMWVQYGVMRDACLQAGGIMTAGICQGATP